MSTTTEDPPQTVSVEVSPDSSGEAGAGKSLAERAAALQKAKEGKSDSSFAKRIAATLDEKPEDKGSDPPPDEDDQPRAEPKEQPKSEPEDTDTDDTDDDEGEATKTMDAKARGAFKSLKNELKELRQRLKDTDGNNSVELEKVSTLETRLTQIADLVGASPEEVEARIQELAVKAAAVDLESTKEYQEAVIKPQEAVLSTLKRTAKAYDIEESQLNEVLHERSPRKQSELIDDLISDMRERDKQRVLRAFDDLEMIADKRVELREKADEAMGQVRQKESQRREQQSKQQTQAVLNSVNQFAQSMAERMAPFAAEVTAARTQLQKELEAGVDTDLIAFGAMSGVLLPDVFKKYQAAQARVEELEKTVASYKKASPSKPGESRPVSTKATEEDIPFAKRIIQKWQRG